MVILMGKTGAGKDTVLKGLQKKGFKKIPTVTTRPARSGEVNNVDYIFTNDIVFRTCIDEDLFAEYKIYHSALGDWWYGSLKSSYIMSSPTDVIILTPDGYTGIKTFLEKNNIDVKIFYITADYDIRRKRLVKRGDDAVEVIRRIKSDEVDFFGLDTNSLIVIENNEDVESAVGKIIEEINSERS